MDDRQWVYLAPLTVSIVISMGVALYAFSRRDRVASIFGWIGFAEVLWSGGYILELLGAGVRSKLFWDNVEWIPALALPILVLALAAGFTGMRPRRPRPTWLGLTALALVSLALILTDDYHHLVHRNIRLEPAGPFQALVYDFNVLGWAISLGVLAVALAGLSMFAVYFLRAPRLYRWQAGIIFGGALFPFVGGAFAVGGYNIGFQRDMFPFTIAVSNLIFAVGLFRFRLFDVVPLARGFVVENMRDMVVVLDSFERVVDLNPAAADGMGRTAGEAIGKNLDGAFPGWGELTTPATNLGPSEFDFERGQGAERRWFNLRSAPLARRSGTTVGRVVILRDVTAQKRVESALKDRGDLLEELVRERTTDLSRANAQLRKEMDDRERVEEQLRHSQRMEAMGRVAGGVAHDLNNMLVPIIGYAELALNRAGSDDPIRDDLEQVCGAAHRATDLVRQILAFSRRQVLEVRDLDLNAEIISLEKILRSAIGRQIELALDLGPGLARVRADKSQLDQILMNLAVNARDAMGDGGRLTIRTRASRIEPGASDPGLPEAGDYVCLTVEDDGEGMEEATLRRVFEPFFTTKEAGKGTGLGLATVFGIVKQHRGEIRARSEPGRGTTFEIFLPVNSDIGEAEKPPAFPPAPRATSGGESILVVEDDAVVRDVVVEALKARGFAPVAAASPEEALRLVASTDWSFDLLLTDVSLPGMNGRELRERIRGMRPGVRAVFMSGDTHGALDQGRLDPGDSTLAKPFTMQALIEKVRSALDG